jgi:hypothetical protein
MKMKPKGDILGRKPGHSSKSSPLGQEKNRIDKNGYTANG